MTDVRRSTVDAAPAGLFGAGLFVLLLVIGALCVVGFLLPVQPDPYNPNPPNPPPYDPNPPFVPDPPQPTDAVSQAAAKAIGDLGQSVPEIRQRSSSPAELRQLLSAEVRSEQAGPFTPINEILNATNPQQFEAVFRSLSSGFMQASQSLRSRDGPLSQFAAALGYNFGQAAGMVRAGHGEQEIHAYMQRANHGPSDRYIDSVVNGYREPTVMLSGYLIDQEHREELQQTSIPLMLPRFTAPPEIDPRGWHRIEDQQSMGSCQGHALSSVCEYTHLVATKQPRQFSPLFAYYASQKRDGLLGRDVGSTIAGGLAAAKDDGSCPDEIMPYRLPYTGRFAAGAYEAARGFLIKRHSVCRNYADVYNFLASGQGGVEIGIRWPDEWMNCSGVLERYSPGMSGGGHAVCFLGYSGSRKDSQGRPYLWLANSWGTRWGQGGWALVSPAAVDQMAQHPDTAMVGMSDMAVARVRDVSWIGKGSVFGEGQQPPQKPLEVLPMFEKPVRVERAAVLRAWKGSVS